MTIWLIEEAHEREGYNGSWYEIFPDLEQGYFLSEEDAQARLEKLQKGEQRAYRERWKRTTHAEWKARQDHYDQTITNNEILAKYGGTLLTVPPPPTEPVCPPWQPEWSVYSITKVEPGKD